MVHACVMCIMLIVPALSAGSHSQPLLFFVFLAKQHQVLCVPLLSFYCHYHISERPLMACERGLLCNIAQSICVSCTKLVCAGC